MTDLISIIKELEEQQAAIERAPGASRELDGTTPDWVTGSTTAKPEVSPRRRSAKTRRKMRIPALARCARARGE
jgi:hypothetical protein